MAKKLIISVVLINLISLLSFSAKLDDFNGPQLSKIWTYRDPANTGKVSFNKGWMILDLKAGADLFIKGVDRGVLFLMDPPKNLDDFSIETMVNPAVNGRQPPACQIGPIFFNEEDWAYSLWGPYNAGQDIRLEDCIGSSYRWRDQSQIAIDVNKVAIDQDVYLMITKRGEELEFFAKGSEDEKWISGGIDKRLGPYYKPGKYKIGLFAKSWGGSVDSTFAFDYFAIPEIAPVKPLMKLTTTWANIKK